MTALPPGPVILVVLDGLGFATATQELGYLEALVEAGTARRWCMRSALPSLSRPLYATLLTGLAPPEHGITGNGVARTLTVPTLFSLARAGGLRTAAAAYAWMFELCVQAPFDPLAHGDYDRRDLAIESGRFYRSNAFPDDELIAQADRLAHRPERPDFLLVHPMGCDSAGHAHGGASLPYRRAAADVDEALSQVMPGWLAAGYRVIVTADHGMCPDGHHGGTLDVVRQVPFYLAGAGLGGVAEPEIAQTAVAPTVLRLLGLPVPASMREPALILHRT